MSLQRDVQQQNAAAKATMERTAEMFAKDVTTFEWLYKALRERGLMPERGVLVRLTEVQEQEGNLVSGVWLSESSEFWEFSLVLSRANRELLSMEHFNNITESVTVTPSAPGTGSSFGFLACQVLREAHAG